MIMFVEYTKVGEYQRCTCPRYAALANGESDSLNTRICRIGVCLVASRGAEQSTTTGVWVQFTIK